MSSEDESGGLIVNTSQSFFRVWKSEAGKGSTTCTDGSEGSWLYDFTCVQVYEIMCAVCKSWYPHQWNPAEMERRPRQILSRKRLFYKLWSLTFNPIFFPKGLNQGDGKMPVVSVGFGQGPRLTIFSPIVRIADVSTVIYISLAPRSH